MFKPFLRVLVPTLCAVSLVIMPAMAGPVVFKPINAAETAARVLHPRIGLTGRISPDKQEPALDTYTSKIIEAGAVPVFLHYGEAVNPLDVDGIVFAGGEDVDPAYYGEKPHPTAGINGPRDRSEMSQADTALAAGLPILGICRGAQLMNVRLGGSLIQDIPSQVDHPVAHSPGSLHEVTFTTGTHLGGLVGQPSISVNSYHHQAVKRLAKGLQIVAKSSDGVVEAWETQPDGPIKSYVTGVQFHPEKPNFPDKGLSQRIFADFIKAASGYAARRHGAKATPTSPAR